MPYLLRDSTLTGHRQEVIGAQGSAGHGGSFTSINSAGAVVVADDFERANQTGLGTATTGQVWKNQASTNFSIATGAAVKQTGTASVRYFALLPSSVAGDWTLTAIITTSATTNTTDTGLIFCALDSTSTRGGQLYLSIRKTSTANSMRLLSRTDTSGSDTALRTNGAAGLADGTTYTFVVTKVGTVIGVTINGVDAFAPYDIAALVGSLGTDVGISFTNTDTGSRVESLSLYDPAASDTTPPPATPTATGMYLIAHRGTTSAAAANTENSVAGLDHLATLRRPVNGIEWDVRVSSDGELFLMHDDTGARTHPAMGATGVEGYTAAQLDTFGVTRLTTGLAAIPGRGFARVNLQHYFPGSNTAAINKLLTQIGASAVASRVKIMTSITGPYAPAQFRSAGWAGPIGTYGSTAANYAGSGDGKSADFTTYNIGWAYLPPGGYTTNRAHGQALIAGGTIKVGASTENSSTQWAQAHADGADEMLTDDSAGFLALYEPPPAAQEATLGRVLTTATVRGWVGVGSVTAAMGRALATATARTWAAAPGAGVGVVVRATVFATARGWTTGTNTTATLARATTTSTARPWAAAAGAAARTVGRVFVTATPRAWTYAATAAATLGRPTTSSTARTIVVVPGAVVRVVDRIPLTATARPYATLGGTVATLTRVVTSSTARPWTTTASVARDLTQATTTSTPRPFTVLAAAARTLARPTTTTTARPWAAAAGATTRTVGRTSMAATARGIASLGGQIATLARPTTTSTGTTWAAVPGTTARTVGRPTATSAARALTASSSSTATLARVILTMTVRAWARATGSVTRAITRPTTPATAHPLYAGGGRPYGATLTPTTGDAQLVPSSTGGHLEGTP